MPHVSRAEFARAHAHVSKPAITKAIASGRLAISPDGTLDTSNPLNVAYIEEHATARAAKATILPHPGHKAKPPPPPKSKPAPRISRGPPSGSSEAKDAELARQIRDEALAQQEAADEDDAESPEGEPDTPGLDMLHMAGAEALTLKSEKDKADIALKRAQTRIHDMRLAEKKGLLVPREMVRQEMAAYDAALKTNLRDMPRRISAQLHALAIAEGPRAVEATLEREIGAALERAHVVADERGLA